MLKPIYILCLLISVVVATRKDYNDFKLVKISPKTLTQIRMLQFYENENNIDFWDPLHSIIADYRVVISNYDLSKFEKFLQYNDISYVISIDSIEHNLKQTTNGKRFDFDHFWTLNEIEEYILNLYNNNREFVGYETIGYSFEGRPIHALTISPGGNISDDNPVILIESTIHAREWIAPMVTIKIIHELIENRLENSHLLKGLNWVIVPVLNVDGYVYTHDVDRFWRKTRSIRNNTDCVGVDPNRNFNFQWDAVTANSSFDNPCGLNYRGPHAESETEIKAMGSLIKRYSNTKLYLSIHSAGQYLLYPWTYDKIRIENYLEHEEVASKVISAIFAVNGTKYTAGTSFELLSLGPGVGKDYAAAAGIPISFTMELPRGGENGFDIEPERIPMVVKETFAGIEEFAKFIKEY